jgi:hypothetical protein
LKLLIAVSVLFLGGISTTSAQAANFSFTGYTYIPIMLPEAL